MANKMGIIHHFLIKIETEGKTIQNTVRPCTVLDDEFFVPKNSFL